MDLNIFPSVFYDEYDVYSDIGVKVDGKYLTQYEKNTLINSYTNHNNHEDNKITEFIDKVRTTQDTFTNVHISGKMFNELFVGSFVKITNEYCADYNNNIYFVDGINSSEHNISFCNVNELYNELIKQYTTDEYYFNESNGTSELPDVYDNITNSDIYVWQVKIPDTANITISYGNISSDVIVLKNKKPLTQHIISSTFDMLNNTDAIKEIEQINYFVKFVKEPVKIDLMYKCALMKNINVFDIMPEERKNDKICLFLATFPDGYEKLKYNITSELLMKCIMSNINIYKQLSEEKKTEAIVNYVLDKNILLYEYTPDHLKTIDNTMLYLHKCNNICSVPMNLCNEQIIINKLLDVPYHLRCISYKHKTYEMCNSAVQKQGSVLQYTPINLIDYNICLNAVINDFNAYQYVPLIYRTDDLKEKMVCCHPCSYVLLNEYDITHNIIMHLLTNSHIQVLNTTNINILSLLALNIMDYYNCCPNIIATINTDIISTSNALCIIKSDINTFKYFTAKHNIFSFVFECVKYGVNFNRLSNMYEHITHDILLELVRNRATVINELPYNMLSDKLYMIALRQQVIKLNDIATEFHTDDLISCAYNDLFANNEFIDISDII